MSDAAFLVVDFGTGGTKCVVFDSRGELVFMDFVPVAFRFSDRSADFDPKATWSQICSQIRKAVRSSEKAGKRIVAVSSTSLREGNVFYDSRGDELLAVPNIDSRASAEAEAISNRFGDLVYEKSGHWPNATFLICRLKWMEGKAKEKYKRLRKVSMINDWVLYKLSGVLASEPTNGCETAAFDLAKRDWSQEVTKELGIDEDLLPAIREGGSILGTVDRSVGKATGIPASASVVVGAADTEAALVGCGALDPPKVAAVAGTTTPVQGVTDRLELDPRRRTWTCCHVAPGRWVVESNAGATGMIFDWWSRITGEGYQTLTSEAAALPSGSSGVSSMIGAMVFNARAFPMIHGELKGILPWTSRGAVSRAIIEGTCFAVRANLEQVEKVLGRSFHELIFCGGAAESELWAQLQADILNRRLARNQARQASARGAAALCQVALGFAKSLEKSTAQRGKVMEPRALQAEAYEKEYQTWLQRLSALGTS